MPAGQVIGRASVKILPDTSDFRGKAKRELERIEKGLKVEIGATFNPAGLKRELLTAIRELNADIKGRDAYKVKIGTKLSTDGIRGELQRAVRRIQAEAKGRNIKLNTSLAAADLKLELDEDSMKHVEREIDRWRRKMSPVKVDVKLELSEPNLRISQGRLAILTRDRIVNIFPMVNSAATAKAATALAALSGARVLHTYFDDLAESIGRLDKSTPLIGSLALAVAGLSGWGLTAASNLFALSSSLAQIGPLGLALPGILGGIAIGLGATALALKDTGKYLPEFGKQWQALSKQVSDNFWARAAEPIRELVDSLMPQFSAGMAKVGTALGGFFGGLADSIKGSLNGELASMFDNLGKSIDIFVAATPAIANIIAVLGQIGASLLPRLAQWVADIATQFSNFLGEAASDGRLQQWIETAIQNAKDLGSVLSGLGSILAGIARAATAAGGSTLGMLGDTLHDIADAVNSPGFQKGLIGVLQAAHAAMSQIATISGPAVKTLLSDIANLLQAVLPTVGLAIGTLLDGLASALSQPAVATGIIQMFAGIAAGIQGLMPALGPVGQALGALAGVVGTLASVLGPLLASAFGPLAKVLVMLAPAVEQIITLLGGGLVAIFQTLGPIIEQVGAAFATLLSGGLLPALQSVVAALVPAISALLAAVAPLVIQLVTGLAPILVLIGQFLAVVITAITPLIALLAQLLSAVLLPLIPVLQNVAERLFPALGAAVQALATALTPVLGFLVAFAEVLMTVLAPVIQFIANLLADTVVGLVNGVGQAISGFVGIITGLVDFIVGVFTGNWGRAWDGVKAIVAGIFDLIVGLIKVFLNLGILKLFGLGLTALKALWKGGWEAVKLIGKLAWDGIKAAFSTFLNALKAAPSSAFSALKTLFANLWSTIKGAAGLAWQAIKGVFQTGVTNAVNTVKALPGAIKAFFSDAGSWLINAGKEIISGLIKGIGSMFGAVKGKLGELTGKLTSWKGPPSTDRVLLVNAGQLVIEGFIDGLESRYDAVRKSLAGLTDDVAKTQVEALEVPKINAAKGISSAISAALDGSGAGSVNQRVLNYYAAPGSSIDSEEDLFSAADRARGW